MSESIISELKTDRLILRAVNQTDVNEVLFLRSDPVVNKFIKRNHPKDSTDALAFIQRIRNDVKNKIAFYWAITVTPNEKMVGAICLWNIAYAKNYAEVGYDLHPDYQGQGIMSEAMEQVLTFGFEQLKFKTIEAFTHRKNDKSSAMLKRNGFVLLKERTDPDNDTNTIYQIKNRE